MLNKDQVLVDSKRAKDFLLKGDFENAIVLYKELVRLKEHVHISSFCLANDSPSSGCESLLSRTFGIFRRVHLQANYHANKRLTTRIATVRQLARSFDSKRLNLRMTSQCHDQCVDEQVVQRDAFFVFCPSDHSDENDPTYRYNLKYIFRFIDFGCYVLA